jgi:hypothetical protein
MYGSADNSGLPVLVDRFFADNGLCGLEESLDKLGICRTGGSREMSALQAYAAAIEVLIPRALSAHVIVSLLWLDI